MVELGDEQRRSGELAPAAFNFQSPFTFESAVDANPPRPAKCRAYVQLPVRQSAVCSSR